MAKIRSQCTHACPYKSIWALTLSIYFILLHSLLRFRCSFSQRWNAFFAHSFTWVYFYLYSSALQFLFSQVFSLSFFFCSWALWAFLNSSFVVTCIYCLFAIMCHAAMILKLQRWHPLIELREMVQVFYRW